MDFTRFLLTVFFEQYVERTKYAYHLVKKKVRFPMTTLKCGQLLKIAFQTRRIYGEAILTFSFELQTGRRRAIVLVINF